MHRSAERLEICEQSRAEKSKVQIINLGVTTIQVVIETIREKDPREEHM